MECPLCKVGVPKGILVPVQQTLPDGTKKWLMWQVTEAVIKEMNQKWLAFRRLLGKEFPFPVGHPHGELAFMMKHISPAAYESYKGYAQLTDVQTSRAGTLTNA